MITHTKCVGRHCNTVRISRGVVDSINHEARMKYFNMSFGELCDKFMFSASANDPDLLKIIKTIKVFWNWRRVQNIPPDQLLWEIAAIVDKVVLKTNTLFVIRASSSAKTRVINNPLVMLARFVGRISNSNASSAFAWMDCVNVRLVSIDEALMAPEAIEKFKNVAGGENTLTEVKHEASMTTAHTPLIFTANRPL